MTSLRRVAACLLLAILLAPGLVQARPLDSLGSRVVERGFFSLLWDVLIAPWLKNGIELDPNGAPRTGTAPAGDSVTNDNGAELDPSGRT